MSTIDTLKNLGKILAVGIHLVAPVAHAQEETQQSVGDIVGKEGNCFFDIDLSSYFIDYVVQSGDSLGLIAQRNNFNLQDIIDIWGFVYPERDPNKLSIGQTIPILQEGYQETYEGHREQIELQRSYHQMLDDWEDRDFKALQEYTFSITPDRPITVGNASLDVLLRMWSHDTKTNAAPNVDSRFIEEAVCAHQARRWDIVSVNPNDTNVPYEYRSLMTSNNVDAWRFNDFYIQAGFSITHDFRDDFRANFSKGTIPILDREGYYENISALLLYLSKSGVPGTKIPTKYLYTSTGGIIDTYEASRNNNDGIDDEQGQTHASHVITYLGNYTSEPFRADYYARAERVNDHNFQDGIPVRDYVAYMSRELGDMWYLLSRSQHRQTANMIDYFAEHIIFIKNGEKIDLTNIENNSVRIHASDMIQIGGVIAMDGFHPYTNPDPEVSQKMTTRLRPLWVYLLNRDMYLVNTLQPSEEIANIGFQGKYGEILEKLIVNEYFFLEPGENILTSFKNHISRIEYGVISYDELDERQKIVIDNEYRLQSMGHQLYGNQNFSGTQWRRGTTPSSDNFHHESATFAYAPIEIFDTNNIEDVYNEYISMRKADYSSQILFEGCSDMPVPFISLVVFPGDTKYTLMRRISGGLRSYDYEIYRNFIQLSIIQRESMIYNLLGEDVFQGNLASGKSYLIGYDEIATAIGFELTQSPDIPSLLDHRGDASPDEAIIDFIAESPIEKYMLSWSLIIESYVDICQDCDDETAINIWNLVENHIFSRRAAKDVFHRLEVAGFQDWVGEQDDDFWSMFPDDFLEILIDKGILNSSKNMKRISSLGDFQIRVSYNMNSWNNAYKKSWPGKNLLEVIDTILEDDGKYSELFIMYPQFSHRIAGDLNVLREVQIMFLQDDDLSRGGDIEKLLRSISFLDPGDQSNIVSKVFWGEIQRYIDRENSQNIFQHILESGQSIDDVDELGKRFPLSMLLVRNMGGEKGLYLWLENYLKRFILHFDEDANFPEIKTTTGGSAQTIYGLHIFMNHLNVYKELILNLDGVTDEGKNIFIQTIDDIDYNGTKQDIFNLFQNIDIKELYTKNGIDTFIIPTKEEFNDSSLFRYTAQIDYIENKRVHKPILGAKELLSPTLLFFIFLQSFTAMIGGGFNVVARLGAATMNASQKVISDVAMFSIHILKETIDLGKNITNIVLKMGIGTVNLTVTALLPIIDSFWRKYKRNQEYINGSSRIKKK